MLILSVLAVFLGSALLFSVQPMVGKRLLPLMGGSPGVWNGCLVFFQLVLLAGYGWVHGLARRPGRARGAGWQLALLLAALTCLPLGLPEAHLPDTGLWPPLWVLTTLALMVGLPALALATTAPLVQAWFAHSGHRRAHDPYFLYAASNLGSFGALLAYPLWIEPRVSHSEQERLWSLGFGLLALLMLALGVAVRRRGSEHGPGSEEDATATAHPATSMPAAEAAARAAMTTTTPEVDQDGALGAPDDELRGGERLRWLALAAVPAGLVTAVTQHLTTDVASVPLLWIVPLGLYLLTYVVAFTRWGPGATRGAALLAPPAVTLAAALLVFELRGSLALQLTVHLSAATSLAMLCHGRLAATRPPVAALTRFYAWLALGGVLGGAFVSLLAPWVFDDFVEYPLLLVAGLLFRVDPAPGAPASGGLPGRAGPALLAAGVGAGACLLTQLLPEEWGPATLVSGLYLDQWTLLLMPAVALLFFARRPVALAAGVVGLLACGPVDEQGTLLRRTRTFFGVHEVRELETPAGRFRLLQHGSTIHGVQGLDDLELVPTAYYGEPGPMPQMLADAAADGPIDMAVVGLGAGALALHGRPGWTITFYEIDPAVVELASDPRLFTCLERSAAETSIVLGDGRRRLAESDATYDVIVLDAFSSDAVPVHLLTVEAIETYLERLRPGGALIFNVSNAYLALAQILAAAAEQLGLAALGREHVDLSAEQEAGQQYPSLWVQLTRSRADVDTAHYDGGWGWIGPEGPHVRAWTDDFSSLLLARWRVD